MASKEAKVLSDRNRKTKLSILPSWKKLKSILRTFFITQHSFNLCLDLAAVSCLQSLKRPKKVSRLTGVKKPRFKPVISLEYITIVYFDHNCARIQLCLLYSKNDVVFCLETSERRNSIKSEKMAVFGFNLTLTVLGVFFLRKVKYIPSYINKNITYNITYNLKVN